MATLKFEATLDNGQVIQGLAEIQDQIHQVANSASDEGESMQDTLSKITNGLKALAAGNFVKDFVSQMMEVRGQFQQTEMAFQTMLGSKDKADSLMEQMIQTAATTPFGVTDVTDGAKQLLAFNVSAEEVNDTLIRLGDVAAGMGLRMSDMVMLYGTTIAKGKMDTQDLYQHLNRGIPIAEALAQVMGLDVTNAISEVGKAIKAHKVDSDTYIKAMQQMTSEGSKFGGLMEAQSKTITGRIETIKDGIEQMFNELGKSQEGIIGSGLDIAGEMVENWREIGKAILVVATAYGTYKAAVTAAYAYTKIMNIVVGEAKVQMRLAAAEGIALSKSEAMATAATTTLSRAFTALKAAISLNPIGLVLTAITTAISAIVLFSDETEDATDITNKFGESATKAASDANNLYAVLQSASAQSKVHKDAVAELKNIAEQYGITLAKEGDITDQLIAKKEQLIGLIKEEAIERERANGITDASNTYQEKIEDVKEDIKSSIGGSFSKEQKEQLLNLINEDDIVKLTECYNEMVAAQQKSYRLTGSWNSEISKGAIDAYNNTLGEITNRIRVYGKELNINEPAINKAANAVKSHATALVDARNAYDNSVDAYNKSADAAKSAQLAADGMTDAQRALADKTRMSKESVKDLASEIQKLIERYNDNKVNIQITYEELNTPPAWMQGIASSMNSKQLKNLAALHQSKATQARDHKQKTGKTLLMKNSQGAITTEHDEQLMAGQYAILAEQKEQEEIAKRKKDAADADEKAKKAKKAQENAKKEAEKQKKAQESLNKSLLALQQENETESISLMEEGTEKKLAEIRNSYKKQIAEIDKQEAEFKKKNNEAKGNTEANGLTAQQSKALKEARDNAERQLSQSETNIYRSQSEAMLSYLKQYGTYQQQRLAIAQEYAAKIAEVERSTYTDDEKKWKIKGLEQERDAATQKTEIDAIKQKIDWGSVFGDFGALFKDQLQPTIDQLKEIAASPEMRNSTLEEQKSLYEIINKLEQSSTVWDGDIFKEVSDNINAYQQAMADYSDAQEREKNATEELVNAKQRLKEAEANGDDNAADVARLDVGAAQQNLDSAVEDVKKFGAQVEQTSSDLQSASSKAVSMAQGLESGLQGLTSGSLKGVGNAILNLDKLFGGSMQKDVANTLVKGFQSLLGKDSKAAQSLTKALGDTGMAGSIISAALGMLDMLKDGASGIVTSLQDTIFGAIEGILGDVFSGDIIKKPLENTLTHVSSILDTVTFGGFSSWVGNGDSDKSLAKDIERLTASNQALQQSIELLTDRMEEAGSLSDISDIYDKEKENIETSMRNTQEMMYRSVKAYSNGTLGFGGHRSSANKITEGIKKDYGSTKKFWQEISEAAGTNVTGVGAFFSLTSEQMAKVAAEVPELYSLIKQYADDGYKDAAQYMDDYISYYQQLEDLEEERMESLTNISFDSVESSFSSMLEDMSNDTSDFSEDMEVSLRSAVVNSMMTASYSKRLKEWYEDFSKAMKSDSKLSESEAESLKEQYNTIVTDAVNERDALFRTLGIDNSSSQDASSGNWQSMGQDTAEELNGRFTALQIAGETIATQVTNMLANIESLTSVEMSTNGATLEIRNMMIMTNSYLEDMVKYAKATYNDFGAKMDDIYKRLKEI